MAEWTDMIEYGQKWGFGYQRKICNPNPTALEVVEQYQYAKKNNFLTKENSANINDRWLQFEGNFLGQFDRTFEFMKQKYGVKVAHIYANWKENGHHYGRHKDEMDVIIVQMWNKTAYSMESSNRHSSVILSPGDALYIKAGVYHTPIVLGERATMSFSW